MLNAESDCFSIYYFLLPSSPLPLPPLSPPPLAFPLSPPSALSLPPSLPSPISPSPSFFPSARSLLPSVLVSVLVSVLRRLMFGDGSSGSGLVTVHPVTARSCWIRFQSVPVDRLGFHTHGQFQNSIYVQTVGSEVSRQTVILLNRIFRRRHGHIDFQSQDIIEIGC